MSDDTWARAALRFWLRRLFEYAAQEHERMAAELRGVVR